MKETPRELASVAVNGCVLPRALVLALDWGVWQAGSYVADRPADEVDTAVAERVFGESSNGRGPLFFSYAEIVRVTGWWALHPDAEVFRSTSRERAMVSSLGVIIGEVGEQTEAFIALDYQDSPPSVKVFGNHGWRSMVPSIEDLLSLLGK